ncbi:hypothetical protein ACJX0J_022736, partial [Zea mays]
MFASHVGIWNSRNLHISIIQLFEYITQIDQLFVFLFFLYGIRCQRMKNCEALYRFGDKTLAPFYCIIDNAIQIVMQSLWSPSQSQNTLITLLVSPTHLLKNVTKIKPCYCNFLLWQELTINYPIVAHVATFLVQSMYRGALDFIHNNTNHYLCSNAGSTTLSKKKEKNKTCDVTGLTASQMTGSCMGLNGKWQQQNKATFGATPET